MKGQEKRVALDDATIKKVIKQYEEGISAPAIGKAINRSSLTVLNILRKEGVTIRGRGAYAQKIKTQEQLDEIFQAYKNNQSLSVIAKKFKVNPNTIYYHMKANNKETRSNRKLSAKDIEYVRSYLANNSSRGSVKQLAEKFGVTPNAIRYHLQAVKRKAEKQS